MPEESPIDKYKRLKKGLQSLLNTTQIEHADAYVRAAKTHLKDEKGRIDYEKLDDEDVQEKFTKTMVEHYMGAAAETLKADTSGYDELERDMLLKAYMGATESQLRFDVKNAGKAYTLDYHKKGTDKLIGEQAKALSPVISSHFKDSHLDEIIDYTGLVGKVKKENMQLKDALTLLQVHEKYDTVNKKLLKDEGVDNVEVFYTGD